MTDAQMRDMLIEYMGNGFLDNIIALYKQDPSVYRFIPDMLASESLQVRLGAVALVEELAREHRAELRSAVPGLIRLLASGNPTVRGDAASVLGTIGDRSARPALEAALQDDNVSVREVVRDALEEIN
jgi:HEAT repeat protein